MKKDNFQWNPQEEEAFVNLKKAMSEAPVLALPDFNQPLIELLMKYNFQWSPWVEEAFVNLKKAMSEAPVLALPNFNQPFILETDASNVGVGAIFM